MTDIEDVPERRAEDQDAAIEVAFVEGTLPEEDRREPSSTEEVSSVSPIEEACAVCSVLEQAGVGTVLEKQSHGWKVTLKEGGTVLQSEGVTLHFALFQR